MIKNAVDSEMYKLLHPEPVGTSNQLSEALDCLNTAANLFEEAGNFKCAEHVTNLIEKIALDLVSSSPSVEIGGDAINEIRNAMKNIEKHLSLKR